MSMRPMWAVIVSAFAGAILVAQVPSSPLSRGAEFSTGHRGDASQSGAGGLAELAADRQRLGLQPARAINTKNVRTLQLAWSWAMTGGANEATPLVHDGIMYLPNPRGVIQALDAATGDLIWEYRPSSRHARRDSACGAMADGAFNATSPSSATRSSAPPTTRTIVASTRRTGKLVVGHEVADDSSGYQYTAGPIVVRGKVIAGITGMQPLQGRRLLHHRPRRGHRQGAVAHVEHRAARRAGRRHLGRSAAAVPRRRRHVDVRQLRSGDEPDLLGHRAGQAVGARGARHRRRRALYELDARARSRHRQDEVVLPAHPRRNAGHGRNVRAHPRRRQRTQVGVHDGQARHPLAARSRHRQRSSSARDLGYQNILDVDPPPAR